MARPEIRRALQEMVSQPQTARDFKNALGVGKSLRVRQAEVVSLSTTSNTATISIAGDQVPGVPYYTCLPCPTFSVWTVTDGENLFITHSAGPAPVIKYGRSTDWTHNSTGNPLDVAWQDPMDANNAPQNNGYDWWNTWASGTPERLTVPAPGVWRFEASIAFANNTTGRRYAQIQGGAGVVHGRDHRSQPDDPGVTTLMCAAWYRWESTTGYLKVTAFQNSGGNLAVVGSGDPFNAFFTAEWKGRA